MATAEKKYNVAVIGYGLSAKVFHIPFINLVPEFALHTIVQRSPSATSSAPADFPSLTHHTSPEPMLADPAVDVVAILTPPNTHFDLASASLRAGKHVLVEKPFVPSSAEAQQLVDLAREQERLICVYQNRRWDADFLTVRKMLAEGVFGRVVEMDTHFDRYRLNSGSSTSSSWKASLAMDEGGGPLYDLGSHLVDQVYALFGMPSGVYGRLMNQRDGRIDPDAPDSVHAVLSYASGLLVTVRIGVASVADPQPRFWVRGTKASYVKTGMDPQEDQLRSGGMTPTSPGFGLEDPINAGRLIRVVSDEAGENEKEGGSGSGSGGAGNWHFEEKTRLTTHPETYVKLFEGFARAIAEGNEDLVPVPASEARDVLRILEAIRESAVTGREVAPGVQ